MNQLISYLLQNIIIDFQGDLSLDSVRACLRDDNSKEARSVLAKITADKSVDDMMITLADCLQEHIKTGITPEVVRNQICIYADS